jgi:hypothetical protein
MSDPKNPMENVPDLTLEEIRESDEYEDPVENGEMDSETDELLHMGQATMTAGLLSKVLVGNYITLQTYLKLLDGLEEWADDHDTQLP